MKVVFKKGNGKILTVYEDDSHITLEEVEQTKELLEYENKCRVEIEITY